MREVIAEEKKENTEKAEKRETRVVETEGEEREVIAKVKKQSIEGGKEVGFRNS